MLGTAPVAPSSTTADASSELHITPQITHAKNAAEVTRTRRRILVIPLNLAKLSRARSMAGAGDTRELIMARERSDSSEVTKL